MYTHLKNDLSNLAALLENTTQTALDYLSGINSQPPATARPSLDALTLPESGLGGADALDLFKSRYGNHMAASAGPRYWGFVTGGTTPAALVGDWLVSAYDTNLADRDNSAAPLIELEAIRLLCELFGLPDTFNGVFVSGATTSNFVGLATGREWAAGMRGHSIAQDGLYTLPRIPVLSATAHSSVYKSLSMLGMGRASLVKVAQLPDGREAADLNDLRAQLTALNGQPCIVIANAGTVNTTDFDDLRAIAALKAEFPFWLHIDAAFGGFAACSPRYAHLVDGLEAADSLTIDAHKWLNVPYDSAMIFIRRDHQALQTSVFQNLASYLPELGDEPDFLHLTPENSRRFRALPAWFTLMAYGKAGYCEIVERNCAMASLLAEKIAASEQFDLLTPPRMNVVCFTLSERYGQRTTAAIQDYLRLLRDAGHVFLTPTVLHGVPAIRAAFSNWRTEPSDVETAWGALVKAVS